MVIEQLTFIVPPALRDRFLDLDRDIWTATLAAQAGFLGKEVWVEAGDPGRLHLIIRWQDRASWKSVPTALLAETDRRFAASLGQVIAVDRCLDQDVIET
jgi:uncharacterized protein (TIGR03792 family)